MGHDASGLKRLLNERSVELVTVRLELLQALFEVRRLRTEGWQAKWPPPAHRSERTTRAIR